MSTFGTVPKRPEGEPVNNMFKGPLWLPQHSLSNDKERDRLVAKASANNPGSSAVTAIDGELVHVMAYGRKVYGVKIGDVVVKTPEQSAIHNVFRTIRPAGFDRKGEPSKLPEFAAGARVYVEFRGRADKGKPGQAAPFLYDVIPADVADVIGEGPHSLKLEKRIDDHGGEDADAANRRREEEVMNAGKS